jgi:hypothetical protein
MELREDNLAVSNRDLAQGFSLQYFVASEYHGINRPRLRRLRVEHRCALENWGFTKIGPAYLRDSGEKWKRTVDRSLPIE